MGVANPILPPHFQARAAANFAAMLERAREAARKRAEDTAACDDAWSLLSPRRRKPAVETAVRQVAMGSARPGTSVVRVVSRIAGYAAAAGVSKQAWTRWARETAEAEAVATALALQARAHPRYP